jgi:C1A family cysteine protease
LMYSSLKDDEVKDLFKDFKKTFNKEYSSKEEDERYSHFVKFLKSVDSRNEKEQKLGGTAVHGVTMFSDLSDAEFQSAYLGYVAPEPQVETSTKVAEVAPYTGKKTDVDWTGVYATDVLDQGYCGSCWAFSSSQQIHSDAIRAGVLNYQQILSPQQLVSCDNTDNGATTNANYGCEGGNTETAFMYTRSIGGISTLEQYPYTSYMGVTDDCVKDNVKNVVTVTEWYAVHGEDQMMDYVMSTGPLSVCVDASDWASYQSGVVTSCTQNLNHCVQIVGVNKEDGVWKVRNSWSAAWGDKGYIYLKYGENMCGIAYDPTYVTVTEPTEEKMKSSGKSDPVTVDKKSVKKSTKKVSSKSSSSSKKN